MTKEPNPVTVVLIVSKDSECVNFVKKHLAPEEFDVFEASLDSDVIQKNNEEYPDILLLDFDAVQMPPDVMISILHKMNPNLEVITLSGDSSLEDAKAIEQGVFYYTSKPVGPEIIEVIKACRNRKKR